MKFGGEQFRKFFTGAAIVAGSVAASEADAQKAKPAAAHAEKTVAVKEVVDPNAFPSRAVMTNPAELKKALDGGFTVKVRGYDADRLGQEANDQKAVRVAKAYTDAYAAYDKQIDWVSNTMNSPEYKHRLIDKEKLTQADLDKRKALFAGTKEKYVVEEDAAQSLKKKMLAQGDSQFSSEFASSVTGYSDPGDGPIHVTMSESRRGDDAVHEATHKSTRNGTLMSTYARDLYTRSFGQQRAFSDENIEYLKDADERNARKGELEYDMEKLGIKKYEETFTTEHYNKLMDAKKKGQLSHGSVEFLDTTKPEYIDRILNTIAYNDTDSEAHTDEGETIA